MKKLFLVAAICGSALFANAEEVNYAPTAGTISTEVQFAPFNSNGNVFSNGGALSVRYFCSDKNAFTLDFGLNGDNEKVVPDTNEPNYFTKKYTGKFSINLGYQRHFYNYKRVDLYVGGKLGYVHQFAGNKQQEDKNNWQWNNSGTGNGFSLYLLTGIDFYVYKGLYLGAEINFGFTDVIATNFKTKWSVDGVQGEDKSSVGGHSFSGGFGVDPKLRLGWSF